MNLRYMLRAATVALTVFISTAQVAVGAETKPRIEIAAGPAGQALKQFVAQTGLQLLFDFEAVNSLTTRPVSGQLDAAEALAQMLAGTGLAFEFVNDRTVTVTLPNADKRHTPIAGNQSQQAGSDAIPMRIAQSGEPASRRLAAAEPPQDARKQPVEAADTTSERGVPEVLVKGSRVLNMDIQRTRDDAQPYVVFDRGSIEKSSATNLEDFLKQKLTMNATAQTASQQGPSGGLTGGASTINLRGLGAAQTLILIDGHRAAGGNSQGTPQQPDLNGLPLAAIERIEVLPATASGIYGGSATGGVINVILRRDYSGLETRMSYDNSFDTDSAIKRVDFGAGMNLEGGRTHVLISGNYSDANGLVTGDRNFLQRARANILSNNPAFFLNAASPPIGATANVRSANGTNLVLKSNNTPLNSPITYVPVGYAGAGLDQGRAFIANAGRYNLDLPNSTHYISGSQFAAVSPTNVESGMVTLRREFTSRIQAFIEGSASTNEERYDTIYIGNLATVTVPSTSPNNPFVQDVTVTHPTARPQDSINGFSTTSSRRAVAGVIVKLPRQWQLGADYTWDRSRKDYNFGPAFPPTASKNAEQAAVSSGVINVLQDAVAPDFTSYLGFTERPASPWYFTMKDAVVRLAGPVWSLPGGPLNLSGMIERREEILGDTVRLNFDPGVDRIVPEQSQSVNSVYLEARVPLISAANAKPGVRELELQIAGRRDEYTTKGTLAYFSNAVPASVARATNEVSSNDVTLGLRYTPIEDVTLRASYGTGFLPPSVSQLVPGAAFPNGGGSLVDPRRNNEPLGTWQNTLGGNPDLRPESSESWSAGVIFTPRFLEGFRLSVDYIKIEKTDNITSFPGGVQAILNYESLFPNRVTRAAAAPGDPYGVGPITGINQTLFNLARTEVEAYDVQLDQHIEAGGWGSFDLTVMATWQPHYLTQALSTLPVIENAGIGNTSTVNANPLRFKANGGVTWNFQQWNVGWLVRYFDSYLTADPTQTSNLTVILNQGNGGRIPSQAYHDVFAKYQFEPSGSQWLDNTTLQVGIRNLFNKDVLFDANGRLFYSPYGDVRLRTYSLSLQKRF